MSGKSKAMLRRAGTWQRGDQLGYVFITSQDWDYYFDEYSDGQPDLGGDGLAYYAQYGNSDDVDHASSRSPTCLTEDEAVERAEALVGPIKWSRRVENW